jgi:ribosomal protein S18 acetylase RimI-like enzyme
MSATVSDPPLASVLEFCAEDPVERVFLEDVARRGLGRFEAVERDGRIVALCHVGANVVPSGVDCAAFAKADELAVGELWEVARHRMARPRADRPGQPVFVIEEPPEAGGTGLRPATTPDLDLLVPACARTHLEEIGVDPMRRDPEGFRWRTRAQIEEGRSWLWHDNGTILFKAEASAWTPSAVQIQQVWVDPEARGRGNAQRGMRDLARLLLLQVPRVCLFVRAENAPAIRVYEAIGMRRRGSYRSLLF